MAYSWSSLVNSSSYTHINFYICSLPSAALLTTVKSAGANGWFLTIMSCSLGRRDFNAGAQGMPLFNVLRAVQALSEIICVNARRKIIKKRKKSMCKRQYFFFSFKIKLNFLLLILLLTRNERVSPPSFADKEGEVVPFTPELCNNGYFHNIFQKSQNILMLLMKITRTKFWEWWLKFSLG